MCNVSLMLMSAANLYGDVTEAQHQFNNVHSVGLAAMTFDVLQSNEACSISLSTALIKESSCSL